jgi:hypothetical protein
MQTPAISGKVRQFQAMRGLFEADSGKPLHSVGPLANGRSTGSALRIPLEYGHFHRPPSSGGPMERVRGVIMRKGEPGILELAVSPARRFPVWQ